MAAGADRVSAAGALSMAGRASLRVLGAVILAAALAVPAQAQIHVGENIEGGLYWSVAAPRGANWSLLCRFQPVTYYLSAYDQKHWVNRFERSGTGQDRGRLPLNAGYCHLTKTGGEGPVAIALARPGEVVAKATRESGTRASVGFM